MIINNKRNLFKFVALSAFLVVTSCNNADFFNEYRSLPNGWEKSEPVVFSFESLDTVAKRNAYINVRTTSEYPYSNLYVIIKTTPPEGNAIVDTLQYQMANADGSMLGRGFTDVKEHRLIWREKTSFKKQGVYKVEIQHAIRKVNEVKGDAVLNGITDIGLQLQ
ncbi:gliding motility lipoprotein GldH [Flavobacterium sp. CBA20B-1]|uniref:gliding motility lipoprotein GldH n=1 Tax=unclassified Flavobacterium TaxID=196869 RepID=UPI0022240B20|nr:MULTISPECIES: gliding motility lipoprotein GldH [unclassified Flavobacterium]WCM41388.1 gliding motility lipoprotein GldH [Flavobacterium sp. CBA20B-1]